VRVLTLNLWGRRGDWEQRRAAIKAGLDALEPDLVAFQEAIVDRGYDQARDLLGPTFHLAHQTEREPDGQGISVGSRWPTSRVHEVDLNVTERTAGFACGALVVEVETPQGPTIFANHLPSWQLAYERERELQACELARFLARFAADRHVVVAGDFDADPASASVRFWTGRASLGGTSVCYRDAWESRHGGEAGPTFTGENPLVADWDWPFGRIDYVLVRCGEHGGPTLRIAACERIFDAPVGGVWASDHFGVVADLELPPAPSPEED
jgi:endonuclease/exonuclease/phosphatase family metal-dependent hydrolase